jgi:hypothetical protein
MLPPGVLPAKLIPETKLKIFDPKLLTHATFLQSTRALHSELYEFASVQKHRIE